MHSPNEAPRPPSGSGSDARAGGLALGIDVGGTGVKGGLVERSSGAIVGEIVRLPTPSPAIIGDVVPVIAGVARRLCADADSTAIPLGVALSGDVRDARHTSGVNLHSSWVGAPARDMLEAVIGRKLHILNDADAAALGEARCGAAAGVGGLVVVLTFGTGIGSGILYDGRLIPNSGLGQLPFQGVRVEQRISAVERERRGLSWTRWASDVSTYLRIVDELLRPDLLVMGGGIIAARDAFWGKLHSTCPLVPAALGNTAGIVGAGLFAANPGSSRRE